MTSTKTTPIGVPVAHFPHLRDGILWTNRCDPAEQAKFTGDGQEPAPGVEEITIWVETPEEEEPTPAPTRPETVGKTDRPRVDGWKANGVEVFMYSRENWQAILSRYDSESTRYVPRIYSLTSASLKRLQNTINNLRRSEKWEVSLLYTVCGWKADHYGDRERA